MATFNLGKVMLTPKGVYSPTSVYTALDIISYSGSSYLVLQEVQGVTPSEGEYYMLIAGRGSRGDQGQAATVSVGTVSSLPAGSTPVVENVGTENDAVFNFKLPQGINGDVTSVDSIDGADGNVVLNAVRYVSQTLSDSQKAQARNNIGATLAGIGAASKPTASDSVSLPSSTWAGTQSCTLTVTGKGLLSTSIVLVEPVNADYNKWVQYGVRCISSGTNTLSFVCQTVPTDNLAFKLVVWNG